MKTKLITGALALIGGASIISMAASQNQSQFQSQNQTQIQEYKQKTTKETVKTTSESEKIKNPVITTKQISKTEPIPFETESYNDPSLPKGQTRVDVSGQNGILTYIYEITYSNGIETSQRLISSERTSEPVTQITAIGTYVAPSPQSNCQNGTYINSAGNVVCRPSETNTGGATAICRDGSYSYSQSRRGTCSYHGGVAQWL